MPELYGRHGTERLDEIGDAAIVGNVAIFIDAGAVMRLAPLRFDGGFFAVKSYLKLHLGC